MRILVTGTQGQVARSLQERGRATGVDVALVGRPGLDLAQPDAIADALAAFDADVVINVAAYTAVDKAETEEELATRINGAGAGVVAAAAAARGLTLLDISTDYVFGGQGTDPYRESDPTGPLSAYGRSKLAGERAVLAAHPHATIVRTAWVYAPFGSNFVRTMLRLGETRDEISVVDDQRGAPTRALDIADALIAIARRRREKPDDTSLHGVFHMTAAGEASWADFAVEILDEAARHGRRPMAVRRIAMRDYPTPARRPGNSRLSNEKLAQTYGVALPSWRSSTRACVARILDEDATKERIG